MFMGAFQIGLRAGQFNESLAQKPADSMEEIIARIECYIKGEESNVEKKARVTKERGNSGSERKNYYVPPNRDIGTFKKHYEREQDAPRYIPEHLTPLNLRPERIMKEVYESKIIREPYPPRNHIMGQSRDAWCKYHRVKGHDTDDCLHLKREIEKLIQNWKLRGYTKERYCEEKKRSEDARETKQGEETRHTLNTISRYFAEGGESSTSRKKYVRQVMLLDDDAYKFTEDEPDITFSTKDFKNVIPQDDDPMVITLQIFTWDFRSILIDLSSSADILYH
jgi:hypothetical protein